MGGGRGGASTRAGEVFATVAAIGFAVLSGSAFAADPDESQILYFEPLRLSASSSTQQKSARSRELQFDAYGRHFVVSLQTNEKLSPLLQSKAGLAPIELYKGRVNGVDGSWARIANDDGQLRGMLWDGVELYVIEPVAKLSDSLPSNIPVSADTTAIFRLKDVVMKPGAASCGTGSDTAVDITKGSDTYGSLLNELKGAPAIMQAVGASRRLELSALGDMLFVNRYGTEARARSEILLRLNNVDGIFSQQLGVEIQVPSVDIGDSLSATTSPSSLLDELADLRKRSPNLNSRGLTHLFTGRDLDAETIGIAFLDGICSQRYGAGLTEASSRSSWTESLIAAHEIGHNFGAPHDGEADKVCADTPPESFLMSAKIFGNQNFSDCSLDVMRRRLTVSCVTALPPADIAVVADFGTIKGPLGRNFDWNVAVSNIGGLSTTNGHVEILVPPAVAVQEAFVIGGSCLSGAGVVTCQLPPIGGGSSTAINLVLRSDVLGTSDVAIKVSASNDVQASNNIGEATLAIEEAADLGIGLQAPASATNGTPFNVSLTASNVSGIEARNITVTLGLPAGVTASSATLNGQSCSVQNGAIACSLDSLASGATVTGTASLIASADGNAVLEARIAGDYFDLTTGNDTATATVTVTTPGATRQTGGSGGGGSASWSLLGSLLAVFGLKSVRRRCTA